MKILVDKKNGIVQWNYEGKDILIKKSDIMYAFEYGKKMIMLKIRNKNGKVKFCIYDNNGDFILSYTDNTGEINLNGDNSIYIDELISVEYSKSHRKVVVLAGKK